MRLLIAFRDNQQISLADSTCMLVVWWQGPPLLPLWHPSNSIFLRHFALVPTTCPSWSHRVCQCLIWKDPSWGFWIWVVLWLRKNNLHGEEISDRFVERVCESWACEELFVWEVITQSRVDIFLVELSGYSSCDAKILFLWEDITQMNILKRVFIKFRSFTRSTGYSLSLNIFRLWRWLRSWYIHINRESVVLRACGSLLILMFEPLGVSSMGDCGEYCRVAAPIGW